MTLLPKFFKFSFLRNHRPPWLINPRTGKRLELDFYCPTLKIAIEVQGSQHFLPSISKYQRYKDRIKRNLCLGRGIRLLELTNKNYKALGGVLKRSGLFVVKDGYFW